MMVPENRSASRFTLRSVLLWSAACTVVLALAGGIPASHAQSPSLAVTLDTDKDRYTTSEIIIVTGSVSEMVSYGYAPEFVEITLRGPDRLTIDLFAVPDTSLNFEAKIDLHPGITRPGDYTLTASYAGVTSTLSLTVEDPPVLIPEPRLLVSSDRSRYLPGQYVDILVDVEPISGVIMHVLVTDPDGVLVHRQILYPSTPTGEGRVQYSLPFPVGQIGAAHGTYLINVTHAGYSASTAIELLRVESQSIRMNTGGGAYAPGQTVWIAGQLDHTGADAIGIEISQQSDGEDRLQIADEITSRHDGSFTYEFTAPSGPQGLGTYDIRAFTLTESGATTVDVADTAGLFGSADDAMGMRTDRAFYSDDQTIRVSGSIPDANTTGVDLLVYRAGDTTDIPILTSVAPISGEIFTGEIPLDTRTLDPGKYWLRASYFGGTLISDQLFIVTGEDAESQLHVLLDKSVYLADDTIRITGIYGEPSTLGSYDGHTVYYSLMTPAGDSYYFRSIVSGDYLDSTWDAASLDDPIGMYRLEVHIGETQAVLHFEVTANPDGSPAPPIPLTISTPRAVYHPGDTIPVFGTAVQDGGEAGGMIMERVRVEIDFGSDIRPFESSVFANDGIYETEFQLPTSTIPSGEYTIQASYLGHQAELEFVLASTPVGDGPELLLDLDRSTHYLGDAISISGGPADYVYVESFTLSLISQSAGGPDCGQLICGDVITSFTIPADSGFHLNLVLSEFDPVGVYEVVLDAGYSSTSATFEVILPPPTQTILPDPIIEKQSRIHNSAVAITIGEQSVDGVLYMPSEITGLLLTPRDGSAENHIGVLNPAGQCIIGPDASCTLALPVIDTSSAADSESMWSYERVGPGIETFVISSAGVDGSLKSGSWIVVTPADLFTTQFYYAVTYLPVVP